MWFQKRLQNIQEHEVNLTPLIDVSLVLVVMLLLTTPLALESSITVRKSSKTAKSAEEKPDLQRIELRVVSEDSVRINRMIVPRPEVTDRLRPLLRDAQERLVVVSCADAVSHGAFVDVLDQAKLSGASEIAVTGR